LKNFGFRDEITVVAPGINAKMNELQAAYGLLSLKYVNEAIAKRKVIANKYCDQLADIKGVSVLNRDNSISHNYSYFPIFIDTKVYGQTRDELYEALKAQNIFSRRYFYPLISDFEPYCELESANPQNLRIAHEIADTVLCLPIYPDLNLDDVKRICNIIAKISAQ
jgi:dTDP-4-amino-4,6-dideoxygalactose transaminase